MGWLFWARAGTRAEARSRPEPRTHTGSGPRVLAIVVTSVLLVAAISMAPAAVSGAAAFSDLAAHWAAGTVADGVAAGYVDGYPDGTFRPDANVTRAEFVKLLVNAGGIPLRPPESWQIFNDVSSHWVEQQAYLDTAGAYGIVIQSDYFGAFEPDRTLTRLEAAVQAVRVLGRQHEIDGLQGDVTLTDGTAMPLWERRYIEMAMQEGILTGYPDNTFRDRQPITRAEAVVIASRTAKAMKVGETPGIKLTVNGQPVTGPVPLSVRSGYVYAPADAIYGGLGHTIMWPIYDATKEDLRLMLFPGNDRFFYERSRAEFPAGAAYAYLRTADSQLEDSAMQQVALVAPTYLDRGRLMIPVAGPDGQGSLPYATARYDGGAATAAVIMAADWPGNRLPQRPAELKFLGAPQPMELQPGRTNNLPLPEPADSGGNRIAPTDLDHFIIHVSVDPASPVRLQAKPGGPMVTSLDLPRYGMNDASMAVADSQSLIPEGTWNITYSATGYTTATRAVAVVDHRPAKLAVSATASAAGQPQTITVQMLDSRGRLVDQSYRSDYENAGPTVTLTLPDGSTARAAPVVHADADSGRPYILNHGVGRFTFTPPAPGTYHLAAQFHPPISSGYGDFSATATVTVGP